MNKEPLHFFNYKGRIFKAIAVDGARTWEDLKYFTNLSADDLNMVLHEMYDRDLIERRNDKTYRITSEIYYAYINYYNQLETQPLQVFKQHDKEITNLNPNESSKTELKESFESFIIRKLVELDLIFIKEYKKGGSAQLYLTYNPSVDDIQIFKLYTSTDQKIQAKYLKYESICTTLKHPNVNSILNTGKWEYDGNFYRWSVQEYIHPHVKSLMEISKNTLLSKPKTIRINLIFQLINGIMAIRNNYNTHNDIHTGNILLSPNNEELKVIDPGFSRKEPGREDSDLNDTMRILEEFFITKKEKHEKFFVTLLKSQNFLLIYNCIKEKIKENEKNG